MMMYTQNNTAVKRILFLLATLSLLVAGFFFVSTRSTAQKTASCSADFFISEMMSNGAKWEMCWEERLAEGIIYHNVYYTTPDGIRRKVLGEASLSQLHVPYDEGTKGRFFDVTDKGFGGENLMNLRPGECEGTLLTGGSTKAKVCQILDTHEYAYRYEGGGVPEYRMMSSLTLSNVSRAQRYFYQMAWEFHDDGTISPSVGATGKLQQYKYVSEIDEDGNVDGGYPYGWQIYDIRDGEDNEKNTYGVSHTHNYWWRLDFDIDGEMNDVVEEFNFTPDPDPRFRKLQISEILTETGRPLDPEAFRSWRIKDTETINGDGHAISYHLEPNGNNIFRGPDTEPWSQNELYVTAYKACEVYAQRNPTIDPTTSEACGENVSEFTNGEPTDGSTDLVVWYGATFHHLPRDEDDIYMALHRDGFHITPRGWTTEYIHEVNPPLNENVDINGVYMSPTLDARRFTGVDGDGFHVPLPELEPTADPIAPIIQTVVVTATPDASSADRGDANCDGTINLVDAILMQRFDSGEIEGTTYCEVANTNYFIYEMACDMNNDGNCSLLDSLVLKSCDVDNTGQFCP